MVKWIEENILKSILLLIIIVLGVPIIVSSIVSGVLPSFLNIESDNDWIAFFGSFIGALISGIFTLIGLIIINDIQDEKRLNQEKKDRQYKSMPVIFPEKVIREDGEKYITDGHTFLITKDDLNKEFKDLCPLIFVIKNPEERFIKNLSVTKKINLSVTINSKMKSHYMPSGCSKIEKNSEESDLIGDVHIGLIINPEMKSYYMPSGCSKIKKNLEESDLIGDVHIDSTINNKMINLYIAHPKSEGSGSYSIEFETFNGSKYNIKLNIKNINLDYPNFTYMVLPVY